MRVITLAIDVMREDKMDKMIMIEGMEGTNGIETKINHHTMIHGKIMGQIASQETQIMKIIIIRVDHRIEAMRETTENQRINPNTHVVTKSL